MATSQAKAKIDTGLNGVFFKPIFSNNRAKSSRNPPLPSQKPLTRMKKD
jgi:hypothetical protein